MSLLEPFYKHNRRRCPSCLEEIYPGDCEIVAEIPKDTLLKKAPRGLRKLKERMYPELLTGKAYTYGQAHRRCYKCQYLLPHNVETAHSLNIAVVGGNRAGKTHYIAALIQEIDKIATLEQFLGFTCLTPDVKEEFESKVRNRIFVRKEALGPSDSIFEMAADPLETTHTPLIYEIGLRPSKDILPSTFNLTIYDTAGEDYIIKNRLVQAARYVLNADALIFVANPVSMPKIFNKIPKKQGEDYQTPQNPTDPTDDFNNVMRQIERFRGRRTGARLDGFPVAIMLSKSDLLERLKSPDTFHFMTEPKYTGAIDLKDIDIIDVEVTQLLQEYDETGLLKASNSLDAKHFFATSATRQVPDKHGMFTAIRPLRCLDPILWILWRKQVVSDTNAQMY